jgi:hypothetical protein
MAREKRRHVRLNWDHGFVRLERAAGRPAVVGAPLNLSLGGIRFRLPTDADVPAVDEAVDIQVFLGHPFKRPVRVAGVVRSALSFERGAGRDIAVMFASKDPAIDTFFTHALEEMSLIKFREDHFDRVFQKRSTVTERTRLGMMLVDEGRLPLETLRKFVVEDYAFGSPLGAQLVARGLLTETELAEVLARQAGLPFVDLAAYQPHRGIARKLGYENLRERKVIPFFHPDDNLDFVRIACAAPPSERQTAWIRLRVDGRIRFYVAAPSMVVKMIETSYAGVTVRFGAAGAELAVARVVGASGASVKAANAKRAKVGGLVRNAQAALRIPA